MRVPLLFYRFQAILNTSTKVVSTNTDGAISMISANNIDIYIVRRFSAITKFRLIQLFTLAVNKLGNGWVYAPIAIGILLSKNIYAWEVIAASSLATIIAHVIYAPVKRRFARLRPFEKDKTLQPLGLVLDRYSFPSGHCMTFTAVLVPITHSAPGTLPFAVVALCTLAWCRIAAGHHYPSDIFAGVGLGFCVAIPVTFWLVPI